MAIDEILAGIDGPEAAPQPQVQAPRVGIDAALDRIGDPPPAPEPRRPVIDINAALDRIESQPTPAEPTPQVDRLLARHGVTKPVTPSPVEAEPVALAEPEQPEATRLLPGLFGSFAQGAAETVGGALRGAAEITTGGLGKGAALSLARRLGASDEVLRVMESPTPQDLVAAPSRFAATKLGEISEAVAPNITGTQGVVSNWREGNKEEAGRQFLFALARNVPQLVALAASGGAGATILGSSAAGNKLRQIEQENPDADPFVSRVNALATGVVEGISEQLGSARLIKRIVGREAVKKGAKSAAREILRGAGVEGVEEFAAQFGENAVDMLTGQKEITAGGLLDGVPDAVLLGLTMGGFLGAGSAIRGQTDTDATKPPAEPPALPEAEAEQAAPEDVSPLQRELDALLAERPIEDLPPQRETEPTIPTQEGEVPIEPRTPERVGEPIDRTELDEALDDMARQEAELLGEEPAAPQQVEPPPLPLDALDRTGLQERADSLGINRTPRTTNKVLRQRIEAMESTLDTLRNSDDVTEKLMAALEIHRQALPETAQLRKAEIARRAARARAAMDSATGQAAIDKARAQLAGEMPLAERQPVAKYFDRAEVDALQDTVRTAAEDMDVFQRINTGGAIARLMGGLPLRNFEIKLLSKVFGPDVAQAMNPKGFGAKAWNTVYQSAGLLRTFKTMLDLSAIGRQGAIIGFRNPVQAYSALKAMGQGMFSQENYETLHDAITSDPRYAIAEEAGLYIAPVAKADAKLSEREEAFASEWADKIPGARISERAFNGYLNTLRADVFNKFVDKWGNDVQLADYRKLADFINKATGRGGFAKDSEHGRNIEKAMPLLSTAFFSPRWVLSRIQTPLAAITPIRDEVTGKLRFSPANTEAIKAMGGYYGMLLTVLAIAKAAGAEVEDDPRSSDFAKIKLGNTRIDLSAGMQQYWRFLGQFISESRKSLGTGKVTPAERGKLLVRMAKSKLAPAPGLVLSAMTGKTFTGDEFVPTGDEETAKALAQYMRDAGFSEKAASRVGRGGDIMLRELAPLIIQQTVEGIQQDGLMGGLVAGGGEFVGVSTSSFNPRKKRRSRSRKRRIDQRSPLERATQALANR